ncbi:MAG: HlyD family efflux transporter periplasmic adaptor subunit [Bacteroidetes bacterium]|nr:HlyD family efflux transporter periplasmic adaptor subunit [Bacteroidota bacterium]
MNSFVVKKINTLLGALLLIVFSVLTGCHPAPTGEEEDTAPEAKTPVRITSVSIKSMDESIELRATSQFQKKVSVKANATGYIDNVSISIGDDVTLGQLLFTIKTKEANAIENPKVINDTSLNFSGLLKIKAQKTGIITLLEHQKGDYVQDGDELGIISEANSLIFILDVPFELHRYIKPGMPCTILFPDNTTTKGTIRSSLPTVDAVSQTQSFVITLNGGASLPENLIVKVHIVKSTKEKAQVLPKTALLADETQTQFWVMKLINDSTAVKIPVQKGIETDTEIEITDPQFSNSDRIIYNGNYGLADTAKIFIQKGTGDNQ